jgi:hypothetical protein
MQLAAFAAEHRAEHGELYARHTIQARPHPVDNGTWQCEVPLPAPGSVSVEIVAEGDLDGVPWRRVATQSVEVSETVKPVKKAQIEDIFVLRNKRWAYTIIGVRVRKDDGSPATPTDGVSVAAAVLQGARRATEKSLPYYSPGGYFIWRFEVEGFKPGPATAMAMASVAGTVLDSMKKPISL